MLSKSDKTAVKCLTLSAEQGDASAQNSLGLMFYKEGMYYKEGRKGVKENYKTAFKWFTLSANQGNAEAQYYLGEMYRDGRGVVKDYKTAVKWLTLSVEQGNAKAQNSLGLMYDNGEGVVQDDKTAVKWYILSAKQGDVNARNNLGWMYVKINKKTWSLLDVRNFIDEVLDKFEEPEEKPKKKNIWSLLKLRVMKKIKRLYKKKYLCYYNGK
tara:strand:- start:161 stop:796 length:636 start_codon:yes stop_codon:yes gene_type:complete